MKKSLLTFFALALLVTGPARAHHNMSATFDPAVQFTATGTLTRIDWVNPHINVSVEVKSEDGQVETWRFEGPSPNGFLVRGMGRSGFEASLGKAVTVEANPARDGSLSGLIRVITLADGVVSLCAPSC
jgi:hypothetical protein